MKNSWIIGSVVGIVIICIYFFGTYSYIKQYDSASGVALKQVLTFYDKKLEAVSSLIVVAQSVLNTSGQREMISNLSTAEGVYKDAVKDHDKIVGAKLEDGALAQIKTEVNKNALLSSSKNVQAIGAEINALELKTIQVRDEYNLTVQKYNTVIKQVPSSFMAPLFGFETRDYFYDSTSNSGIIKQ